MSIRTRFGSDVEILAGSRDSGRCTVRRKEDGEVFVDISLLEVVCDRGAVEIDLALDKVAGVPLHHFSNQGRKPLP